MVELSWRLTGRRRSRRWWREALLGYAWISAWIIGFIVFTAGPMLASLFLSLTTYRLIGTPKWVGLQNYIYAFSGGDKLFWLSLRRTSLYVAVSVPLGLIGSLLAALLLNQRVIGTTIFRTLFFLPSLTPVVAAAVLWLWVLNPDFGMLNTVLAKVGITGPAWLGSVKWAVPSIILISVWTGTGGGRMIIFLAGLQGVPAELYEACELDGANRLQKFRHVTLPMISPTIFFNLVLGIIGAFGVFAIAFVASQGGPAYATWFYALNLYAHAFQYYEMGYACALAWIFFIIVLILTLIQLKFSERWVFYAGG